MSPPGLMAAAARPVGSWNSGPGRDRDRLIADAHLILTNVGVAVSPSKVRRLVIAFEQRVERNGFSFFEFLANSVALSVEERRSALLNPEIARVIAYADPTGDAAVNHVQRQRGY